MSKKRDFDSANSESETSEKKTRNTHYLFPLTDALTETQRARIKKAEKLDDENTTCVEVWCDAEQLDPVLAMYSACSDQPLAWPRVLGFNVRPMSSTFNVYFDVGTAYAVLRKNVGEKSLIHIGYSRFFDSRLSGTQSVNLSCKKDLFVDFPYPKPRSLERILLWIRQYARIVREYMQREEIFNDNRIISKSFFCRSLLLDPFSIYRDEFNRVFHIPMVCNTNFHPDFLPRFVDAIIDCRAKFRVASLIALVRICYLAYFGRSFDADFETELCLPTVEQFRALLRADKFPVIDFRGEPASVMLIDWMMLCLKNTIKTQEIDNHVAFSADHLLSSDDTKDAPFRQKYTEFTNLLRNSIRITDEVFNISVPTECTELNDDCLFMKSACVATNAETQKITNFSLSVFAAVLKILRQKREYPRGMLLSFTYSNAKAIGSGVAREIVFRTFEGMKHWAGFEFSEANDMLDIKSDKTSAVSVDTKLEFIVALIYWVVTNNETMPFMLSPSLLGIMFNLVSRNSMESMINYARITNPTSINSALNSDDREESFSELHGVKDRYELMQDYATTACCKCFDWKTVSRFSVTNPVLQNFQELVRLVYTNSYDLSFLLSRRVYDVHQGRKWTITPALAVSLLRFGNFDAEREVDVDQNFLDMVVASIESTFKPCDRKLLHYLTYHTKRAVVLDSDFDEINKICGAARRQTYCFFIRWILEASEQQLSNLWNNLHGFTKIIPLRYDFDAIKLPTNALELAKHATTAQLDKDENPFKKMVSLSGYREQFCHAMRGKHVGLNQSISVDFRIPTKENNLQLAPQFFTCTSSIVLSICHSDYESFAESMNESCSDNKVGFTTDT